MEFYEQIAEVPAPAKINLCLLVGPRRADGYHPICSVMEKITLFDTLRTMPEAPGTGIRLTGSDIPREENLVMKAARALEREVGRQLDVDIELRKEIPVAAGLAGGSSDAAAILKLLDFAFKLEVPPERLHAIAGSLGADVPFFLTSGPQLAESAGELLAPLSGLPDYALVLVKPKRELSTASVYEKFDELGESAPFEERCRRLKETLAGIDSLESLLEILENDLEPAAAQFFELDALKSEIVAAGALGALMSGSGSSVFGLFNDAGAARIAAGKLQRPDRQVWAATPFRQ